MNQPSRSARQPSNALLVISAVCAVAVAGLLLVTVLVSATGGGTANSKAAAPQPQSSVAPIPAPAAPIPAATESSLAPPAPTLAPAESRLDPATVAAALPSVLRKSYGIADVEDASCPDSMPARVGAVYDCTLTIGGENKTVSVRVTTRQGTYEVGRPS
ncbi:DUF4333 domain-containing protein [Nocardia sp. SYP-A9097]|uniref:DUF4333 domain-containing protein n=1 Tax=Nocardia sp. SYP-A9097 TaxID=2663237 RepID=UPI001890B6DB|nr:DUF4333 domain-containing protein [Nocardia sp. SYP-A9097]